VSDQTYFLANYADSDKTPRAGIVVDDRLVDVGRVLADRTERADAGVPISVMAVLQRWEEIHPILKNVAKNLRGRQSLVPTTQIADVILLAPIQRPGTIFCAGANYKDHVAEMSKAMNLPAEPDPHELGLKPWHFIKSSVSCVRGTGVRIALPSYSKKVDWEAEIAAVIGRECRNVSIERALEYVAGLSIVNDLSARDHLRRPGIAADSPFFYDWVSQKCFEGALPFGPWICPLEFVGNPGKLGIRLWVNDELMQDSTSDNMIFTMAEQIAHLSSRLTLMPGDVIATGTPAGCGSARGRFLQPGDRVRVWVENIGVLANEFTQ
jgi:2-keto-4-pentenoate hydratase/2-oxohepta-3-ene-1,7-dioic acid hydratase in catechol pathway